MLDHIELLSEVNGSAAVILNGVSKTHISAKLFDRKPKKVLVQSISDFKQLVRTF